MSLHIPLLSKEVTRLSRDVSSAEARATAAQRQVQKLEAAKASSDRKQASYLAKITELKAALKAQEAVSAELRAAADLHHPSGAGAGGGGAGGSGAASKKRGRSGDGAGVEAPPAQAGPALSAVSVKSAAKLKRAEARAGLSSRPATAPATRAFDAVAAPKAPSAGPVGGLGPSRQSKRVRS